jgi:rubrerythrin
MRECLARVQSRTRLTQNGGREQENLRHLGAAVRAAAPVAFSRGVLYSLLDPAHAVGAVMAPDERLLRMFSYYRDAELRGATLLLKLMQRLDDPDAQVKLAKHLEEETHHAWLWTKRITDMGGVPVRVDDGYQRRIGLEIGVPKSYEQLFALTVVVEERAHQRYLAHAASPTVDPETRAVLHEVTKDEKWHIAWMENKLREMAGPDGQTRVDELLARYREVDRRVFRELEAKEREAFGFSLSETRAS